MTNDKTTTHLLIIGQGIAGTCLAWEAIKAGYKVTIIDRKSADCASAVSSGLINPITGRHFVKSWMIDDFIAAAKDIYGSIETHIGGKVIYDIAIVRHLSSIAIENTWETKSAIEGYEAYMEHGPDRSGYDEVLHGVERLGTVKGAMRIDAGYIIKNLRAQWIREGRLIEASLDIDKLQLERNKVTYDGVDYSHLVLAMGWRGMDTIFKTDVYRPVKGEVLIAEILGFPEEYIIKFGKFLVPLGNYKFWIGSTYQWEWQDESSDQEKSLELEQFLIDEVKLPYTILDRRAGVRPATKYRRPLIGRHPDYNSTYLMNGLGTKGVSMAPYWAKQIVQHIDNAPAEGAITEAFGRIWP